MPKGLMKKRVIGILSCGSRVKSVIFAQKSGKFQRVGIFTASQLSQLRSFFSFNSFRNLYGIHLWRRRQNFLKFLRTRLTDQLQWIIHNSRPVVLVIQRGQEITLRLYRTGWVSVCVSVDQTISAKHNRSRSNSFAVPARVVPKKYVFFPVSR